MVAVEPFFARLAGHRLFCVLVRPNQMSGRAVLYVPPFAEEANRSRHLAARQAREFAKAGWAVLIVDPYGTGDSAGAFGEADWQTWCADMQAAKAWLHAGGYTHVVVWGVRLGAALALSADVTRSAEAALFWQPVFSGKTHLNQLLRLRLAGDMAGEHRVSRDALEDMLRDRGYLDVAGYTLSAALVDDLRAISDTPPVPTPPAVAWFEVSGRADRTLTKFSQAILRRWRAAGSAVHAETVSGEPFWATQELGFADELIEKTTGWMTQKTSQPANTL
jgi:exosortase A-associated hydrolase 2